MTTQVGTVKPVALEWMGAGREAVTGTIVSPSATIPSDKIEPDEHYTLLEDKAIRGMMGSLFSVIPGTQSAAVDFSGPVYLDTIGAVLLNLMGDYSATGSTPTNSTTTTASAAVGATTISVTADVGMTAQGSIVQIGTGATAEVVVLSAASTGSGPYVLTFANNPLRFAHASASTVANVVAPFTHTFALLNSGNGQPPTHTITHYNGLTGTYLAAQYAYWCAQSCAFSMDPGKLFTHDTKGISYIQQSAAAAPTNSISSVKPFAGWQFAVGIGGPATGGSQVYDVTMADLTIDREVKPDYTASGQQAPYVIWRNALTVSGKFTEVAQNSNPMGEMLNNTQPQLQFLATNGLSGANLLSVTFNMQQAAVETVKLNNNGRIEYESTFKCVDNSTNVGGSGGLSPASIVLVNAVPTF